MIIQARAVTVNRLLTLLSAFTCIAAAVRPEQPHAARQALVSHNMCTTPSDWSPPFTEVYHLHNGATLVFVGVEHGQNLTDPTHRQLKDAFDKYKPGFVLVEGASSAKSAFDWYRKALGDDARKRTDAGAASENLYAVRLALDTSAQFSGWDFSPDFDYRVLLQDRFSINDALGAHLLRSHVDPFDRTDSATNVARQLRYATIVQPIENFDYAAWYRKAYGERYDPANGTPCGRGIASRIVEDLSYRRNLNMVGLIESHAVSGQTVLVEAGANHWLAVRDWLRSRSAP